MRKNMAVEIAQLRRAVHLAATGAPRHITNADIARAAGLTPGTVSSFMKNPAGIKMETVAKIHDALVSLGVIKLEGTK